MLNKIPERVWSAFWRSALATVFAACLALSVCSVTAPAAFAQPRENHMLQGHHAGQWLRKYKDVPPQQQQRVLNRMETWEHLTPEQKQRARQIAGRFQSLPPARRAMLHNAINELREVPPGQREQMIDSDRFKSQFTPEELGILHNVDQLPLAPAEAGAPEPHN